MNLDQTVKLGAVGVGGIYRAHQQNLALLGGNEVVAMCDMSPSQRAFADENGARFYQGVEQMLDQEPELDALISCTPPLARRSVVEAAAQHSRRRGRALPVFVEKPPAFALDEARTIVRIARENELPVFVGFMYRTFPIVNRLRELLGDRQVHLVQSSFFCPAITKWNLPAWFLLKEKSGSHILDQAIHSIDLIRFLVGDITHVHTFGNNLLRPKGDEFTVEESSATTFRFASGASGTHLHSWTHDEFKVNISLIGTDFRLDLELDDRLHGFVGDQRVDETLPAMPSGAASHHLEEMRLFLEAVRSGDFSILRSPYADAARSLATVVAMNESIETGAPVEVASVQ